MSEPGPAPEQTIAKALVLPKPRPEVVPEVLKPPFSQRYKVLLRVVRVALTLTVLGLLAFAWMSYEYYTVPGERGSAPVLFDISRGDSLILARFRPWRDPKVGDIVFYRPPGTETGAPFLIGRIEGVPGVAVKRRGPTMQVAGREPLAVGFELGPDARIRDGEVIPAGRYLIMVDTDAVAYSDSRVHGYVALENIEYRLAINLAHFWARK